jgi:hypothetical protein
VPPSIGFDELPLRPTSITELTGLRRASVVLGGSVGRPATRGNRAPRERLLTCPIVLLSSLEAVSIVERWDVRAGARAYFGPRRGVGSRVGDVMFDGVIPLGEALRPLDLSRPSTGGGGGSSRRELAAAQLRD